MSPKMDRILPMLRQFSKLSLRWKIYLSLTAILIPVFILTIFVQTQLTMPLLEEEVRQIGTSVCRSLATDIVAFHLLSKPEQLETRLVEMSWLQPSIMRLDVIIKDGANTKLIASNVVEETPLDLTELPLGDTKITELRHDNNRKYWEIVYPIVEPTRGEHPPKEKHILGYLHTEVSLQLADQVVRTFSKIALLGALLEIVLLILLLSYYLRRMIENERKLRQAEFQNVELTQQLHEIQRQLFLNEKLAIMGQLTASFAHEIGTPLNSLSGHLQLLRDEVKSDGGLSRLEVINSQVSRIEGIVKEFLASTHTPPKQKELVDVREIIDRITKLVAPRIQKIHAHLSIDVEPRLEPLRVVPTDLEQVLLNLANNAIDALEQSANDKALQFEAKSGQDHDGKKQLEIYVKDTGEGIPTGDIKQVLKPFYTTKAPGQGTGLGLTISQRLIKKYGGKLELESTLGKGTTIKVSIPYDLA